MMAAAAAAAATTSSSNRIITFPAVSTRITDVSNEPLDPLPDETVVKAGWLTKKGRRGVKSLHKGLC